MNAKPKQLPLNLPGFEPIKNEERPKNYPNDRNANKLALEDRAIHDWYRFVLSFPPHLVKHYIQDFKLNDHHVVLDPFCGTGTTLVEAKLNKISAVGVEANPFTCFASTVKLDWDLDPDLLLTTAQEVAQTVINRLHSQGIDDTGIVQNYPKMEQLRTLDRETEKLLLKNSISPIPLHKTLVLLDILKEHRNSRHYQHMRLALANALVYSISNLRFGPEVGVGKKKTDAPVIASWLSEIRKMTEDLRLVASQSFPEGRVLLGDSREIGKLLPPRSVDAVITSPPYPNEKDYTRTTRLESVLLGFITSKAELRRRKKGLVRSNTRGVYKGDDDDIWVAGHPEIQEIAEAIEKRRNELGKDSGFEKLYSRVTQLYFGGMSRHLADLRKVLRPGASLAYVVGDQASYLRIMIRTGQLITDIAKKLGFEIVRIDLFRTRFSTATKEQLREEVVILRWP